MIGFGSQGNQIASLFVKIGADARQFENAMGGVERRLGVVGGAVTKFGALTAAAAVGGIAAVGTGLTMALRSSAEFEKVMSGAGAVLGATGDQMSRLNALALQLGKDTAYSAAEAASAIEMLAKNGINAEQILGGMADATIALAAATGANLSTSADVATDAMMQFGLSTEQVSKAINGISGVVVNSKFDINDYALALSQGGGVAAKVGVTFDDFNTTIAAISSAFGSGSDAGTSFKVFLQRLVPQSDKASDAMRALGLFTGLTADEYSQVQSKIADYQRQLNALDPSSTSFAKKQSELTSQISALQGSLVTGQNAFFDANGSMKSMAEIAGILQNALGGLSDEARISALSTIFGTDAMRAAATLAEVGTQRFNEIADAMSKVDAAQQAAKRLDNLAGDVEQLSGSFDTLKIKMGQAFTPLARRGVQLLTSKLNELIDLDFDHFAEMAERALDSIGGTIKFVQGGVTALMKGFQKMRGTVGGLLRPFAGPLKDLLTQFKTGFALGFDKADFSGPVKGIFTGLVDMWLSAERWMLNTGLPALLTTLGKWGTALIEWVAPYVPGALRELGGMVAELVQWMGGEALPAIGRKLSEWGSAFVDWIGPQVPGLLRELGMLLSDVGSWIKDTALPVLSTKLKEWGAAITEWVKPQIPVLLAKLGELWSSVTSWVTDGEKRAQLLSNLGTWGQSFLDWAGGLWGDQVKPQLAATWEDMKDWITDDSKRSELLNTINERWTAFADWAKGIWKTIQPKFKEMYNQLIAWINEQKPGLGTTINGWVNTFVAMPQKIQTAWNQDYANLKTTTARFVDDLTAEWNRLRDNLVKLFGSDGKGGALAGLWSGIEYVISVTWDNITSSITTTVRTLNSLLEALKVVKDVLFGNTQDVQKALEDLNNIWENWLNGTTPAPPAQLFPPGTPGGVGVIPGGVAAASLGLGDALGMSLPSSGNNGVTVNVNVSADTIPTDRSKIQELARLIWREAELSGLRL